MEEEMSKKEAEKEDLIPLSMEGNYSIFTSFNSHVLIENKLIISRDLLQRYAINTLF